MAAIGEFLLCWGWLEEKTAPLSIPVELEPIRKMRNTMCHGLYRAHANPWEDESTAFIECKAKDQELVKYSLQEIIQAIRDLRDFRRR